MLASEVIKRYEAYCPQEFSMEGDVRGLQVGTLQKDIHKVMVALDIREQTVAEAIAQGLGSRSGSKSDLYRFDQA